MEIVSNAKYQRIMMEKNRGPAPAGVGRSPQEAALEHRPAHLVWCVPDLFAGATWSMWPEQRDGYRGVREGES